MAVRVGVIGAGWAARHRHLGALASMNQVRLSRIWSRDLRKARQLAEQFQIEDVSERWEDVVTSRAVDAVIVATPPILHCAATLAALKSGKHVLCQARMARNLQEAKIMALAAKESDLVTALYPAQPGLKGGKVVRHLLHEKKFIGRIREVRVIGISVAAACDEYQWQSDPEIVGVNAMSLGLWNEVANRWVGTADSVAAVAHVHEERKRSPEGGLLRSRMPDSLAVAARLGCGATASYHFSAGAGAEARHGIEIFGTEGVLSYEFFKEELHAARIGEELKLIPIPPAEEGAQDTDVKFIEAITAGDRNIATPAFEEGLRYMEFCEAVALSALTGSRVLVPPEPTMDSWGRHLPA